MEQNFNSNQNDFLWTLLANPAEDARPYLYNLQRLVNDYPQSGILQALLAHASEDKNLRRASTYLNPSSVYKLINTPSSLVGVPGERMFISSQTAENRDVPLPVEAEVHGEYNGNSVLPAVHPGEGADIPGSPASYNENAVLPGAADDIEDLVITEIPVGEDVPAPVISENESEVLNASEVSDIPQPLITETAADDESPVVLIDAMPGETESYKTAADEVPVLPPEMPPLSEHITQELPAESSPYAQQNETTIAETAWENLVAGTAQANKNTYDYETSGTDEHQPDRAQEAGKAEIPPAIPAGLSAPLPQSHASAESKAAVAAPQQADEQVRYDADVIEHTPDIEEDAAASNKINDEVFDEIVAIDQINITPLAVTSPTQEAGAVKERKQDFFTFEEMYGERKNAAGESSTATANEKPAVLHDGSGDEQAHQDVSMYHDEKLPYSFLWWLDKTRKEHAGIYQPYVHAAAPASGSKSKKSADELQQQYYENIFHITSIEELERSTASIPPVSADNRRREQLIIEKFIKEEPQIRPQSSDKLDNENKAKKSSEDRDELVSETLAAIYSDQMLYHKAISSYKKLMLKFPQKSVYFAGKIEQLEKKIN